MKYTKILMMLSALFMGVVGILLQFFPNEVLTSMGTVATGQMSVFVQIAGALYLGFAMTNWMAKAVIIGGIYARPLAIGNLLHFVVGALAILKFSLNSSHLMVAWLLTAVYALFAVLFGIVFFTHPLKVNAVDAK